MIRKEEEGNLSAVKSGSSIVLNHMRRKDNSGNKSPVSFNKGKKHRTDYKSRTKGEKETKKTKEDISPKDAEKDKPDKGDVSKKNGKSPEKTEKDLPEDNKKSQEKAEKDTPENNKKNDKKPREKVEKDSAAEDKERYPEEDKKRQKEKNPGISMSEKEPDSLRERLKQLYDSLPSFIKRPFSALINFVTRAMGMFLHNTILGDTLEGNGNTGNTVKDNNEHNKKIIDDRDDLLNQMMEALHKDGRSVNEARDKDSVPEAVHPDKKDEKDKNSNEKNERAVPDRKNVEKVLKEMGIGDVSVIGDNVYFPDRSGKKAAVLDIKDAGDATRLAGALYHNGKPAFCKARDNDIVKLDTAIAACTTAARINFNDMDKGTVLAKTAYEASYGKMQIEVMKSDDQAATLKVNGKPVISNIHPDFLNPERFNKGFRVSIEDAVKTGSEVLKDNHIGHRYIGYGFYTSKDPKSNDLVFYEKTPLKNESYSEIGRIDLNKVRDPSDFRKAVRQSMPSMSNVIVNSVTYMYCNEARNEPVVHVDTSFRHPDSNSNRYSIPDGLKPKDYIKKCVTNDGKRMWEKESPKEVKEILDRVKAAEGKELLLFTKEGMPLIISDKDNSYKICVLDPDNMPITKYVDNIDLSQPESFAKHMDPMKERLIIDDEDRVQMVVKDCYGKMHTAESASMQLKYSVNVKPFRELYDAKSLSSDYVREMVEFNSTLRRDADFHNEINDAKTEAEKFPDRDYSLPENFTHEEYITMDELKELMDHSNSQGPGDNQDQGQEHGEGERQDQGPGDNHDQEEGPGESHVQQSGEIPDPGDDRGNNSSDEYRDPYEPVDFNYDFGR